jgi:excinuclease UvrABC nuclease subunit
VAVHVSDKLTRKIGNLPRGPGVYLFKDARHEVIYVGKGKDLRARHVDVGPYRRYNPGTSWRDDGGVRQAVRRGSR